MQDPVLQGTEIYLRPARLADANERYLGWLQDPEVNRFLEVRHQTQTLETIRAFIHSTEQSRRDHLFAICLNEGGRHIGNLRLGPVDAPNAVGTIGLMIGERACWGRGYATQAIALVCKHAFETMCLRRLTAGAYWANVGSIRAFERNGFVREGVLRGGALYAGAPMDVVILGRLK